MKAAKAQPAEKVTGALTGEGPTRPMRAQLIQRAGAEYFDLRNRVTIEVHTRSYRSVRGYSVVPRCLTSLPSGPPTTRPTPTPEVIASIKPAMATIPNAMLLCASSPYSRKGALFDAYKGHYGKDGDPVLIWQAGTPRMNPTVPQATIDEAIEQDPANARAEWWAQFRDDICGFVDHQAVLDCVEKGVRERPRRDGASYRAFVDPSGGSSDSMTCAIGHKQGDGVIVVDALREITAPFDPESAADEIASLIRSYGGASTFGIVTRRNGPPRPSRSVALVTGIASWQNLICI